LLERTIGSSADRIFTADRLALEKLPNSLRAKNDRNSELLSIDAAADGMAAETDLMARQTKITTMSLEIDERRA
jgi:hypothetical protein